MKALNVGTAFCTRSSNAEFELLIAQRDRPRRRDVRLKLMSVFLDKE